MSSQRSSFPRAITKKLNKPGDAMRENRKTRQTIKSRPAACTQYTTQFGSSFAICGPNHHM
eukprot:1436901-Amphidinium_carterae.3